MTLTAPGSGGPPPLRDDPVETQGRRDIVLTVRAGGGPDSDVRADADADVVRALDRLVSRTCRSLRG